MRSQKFFKLNLIHSINLHCTKYILQHLFMEHPSPQEEIDEANKITFIVWVFILRPDFSLPKEKQAHIENIHRFFFTSLGHSFEDYTSIMLRIESQCTKGRHFEVNLAMDLTSYKVVFNESNKHQIDSFSPLIKKIQLFSPKQEYKIGVLRLKHPLISDKFYKFEEFLTKSSIDIEGHQEQDKKLLPNFNLLGVDKSQKEFKERRLKVVASTNLEEKDYEQYLQKFLNCNEAKTDFKEQMKTQLEQAMKQLKIDQTAFYKRIFALYKRQSIFYKIINSSLKRFYDKSFNWTLYALPICFMFKAIKMYFKDERNREQIERLFDSSGMCTVYRIAKISNSQLQQIQQNLKKFNSQDQIFYELASFTSTSLQKKIALNFLEADSLKNSCLIKFNLPKPSFQEELLPNLQFLDFSFAFLQWLKEGDEKEILLNSLSTGQIKGIKDLQFERLKKDHSKLKTMFPFSQKNITLPEIEIDIVDNLIHPRRLEQFAQEQLNSIQLPQSYRHYLSSVNIIKNCQLFDIGHAFEHTGNLQLAKKHFQAMLEKVESSNVKNKNEIIYHLKQRLVDILQKLDNIDEALHYADEEIQDWNLISQNQSNLTRKEHHLLLYKMVEKSTQLSQGKYSFHKALQTVNNQINILQQKSKDKKNGRLASLFQCAQFYKLRGIIYFKEYYIDKAREDILRSKQMIKKIMEDINYEGLKTETFYIQFIIHFLVNPNVRWEPQEFNKKRRMECIAEATYIFGGQKKLQQLANSLRHFGQQINEFLERKQKEKDEKNIAQLIIDPQTIIKKAQIEFGHTKITEGIKNQVEQFFSFFQEKLKENEQQARKAIDKQREAIQLILIQQNPQIIDIDILMDQQQKLRKSKQNINKIILYDWTSKFQEEGSSSQLLLKYDQLIQQKRNINKKLIEEHYEQITRQNFRKYLKRKISNNKQVQQYYRRQNYPIPEDFRLKLQYQQALLFQSLDDKQEQLRILDQMIVETTKKHRKKFLELSSSYFMKLSILFSQAEIEFQESLLFRGTFERQNIIRAEQKKYIDECKHIFEGIQKRLAIYEAQNKIMLDKLENEHKIKVMINEIRAQIEIWSVKLNIIGLIAIKNSSVISKKINLRQISLMFVGTKEKIDNIQYSSKISQFKADYYQANADFFFIDNQFSLCLDNLLCAFNTTKNSSKKVKILTKLFMMLGDHINLSQLSKQISHKYNKYESYPAYWRICLAYHFCYRFVKKSSQPLEKAIKAMSRTPAYSFKLKLIQQCERKFYLSFLSKQVELKETNSTSENPESVNTSQVDIDKKNQEFYKKNQSKSCTLPDNKIKNKVFIDFKSRIKLNEHFRIVKRAKTMNQVQKRRQATKKTTYQQYLDEIMKNEFI